MNSIIKYSTILVVLVLGVFIACQDDAEGPYKQISDIGITGLEKSYKVYTKVGEKLEISPVVSGDYPESEYAYYWYIANPKLEENQYGIEEEDLYKAELISQDKALSYEVNLPLGHYNLFLKVESGSNKYSVIQKTEVTVLSRFSSGYYILKENDEGNTELDLLVWNEKLGEDSFFEELLGNNDISLTGAPRALSFCYEQTTIVDDQKMGLNNLCITTEENKIQFISTSDFQPVIDLSNMFYDPVGSDEVPYTVIRGYFMQHYLSNRGVSSVYSFSNGGSGIFPEALGRGGSPFVVMSSIFYSVFWNSEQHSIMTCDFNGDVAPLSVAANLPHKATNLSNLQCRAIGQNLIGKDEIIYLLLEDSILKKKYLYLVGVEDSANKLMNVVELDEKSHLFHSDIISTNGREATILYCVDNNKLYSHNINYAGSASENRENELILKGIPANEEIAYVTNQYWLLKESNYNVNYFIVATQTGAEYTCYFYKTLGGVPVDTPVKIVKGKGKVKSIKYMVPSITSNDVILYPYAD